MSVVSLRNVKLACLKPRGQQPAFFMTSRLLVWMWPRSRRCIICEADASVLSTDFIVYSAYGIQRAGGISLLIKRTLVGRVNLVHVEASRGG